MRYDYAFITTGTGSSLYGSALLGKQQCMRTLCYWCDWDDISEQTKVIAVNDATPYIATTTETDTTKQVKNNFCSLIT
jgi:hypothetical protein